MKYTVSILRRAGLEAKWSRTRAGKRILLARDPLSKSTTWWHVSDAMKRDMEKHGVKEAFDRYTLLGAFFSIPIE